MDLPPEHELIWRAIYDRPGEANAAPARVILREAGLPATAGARLRDVVHELRTDHHLPVGSTPAGYFRLATTREFASQRRRLRRRALHIMAAAAGVRRAWLGFDEDRRFLSREAGEQERLAYDEGARSSADRAPCKPIPRVARRARLETARAQNGRSGP